MLEQINRISTFTDLVAWQEARKLTLLIYKSTDSFPSQEIYTLVSQMRRCSISIISNIAEGFSRQSKKEKLQFYYIAKGSLTELQSQLIISGDLNYIDAIRFKEIQDQITFVGKLLVGLIRKTKE